MKSTYILAPSPHPARQNAMRAVQDAPDGWMVQISEPKRKDVQNAKIHAMIGDIAKQCMFMGKKMDADDWKRLLVDMFAKVMRDAKTPLHHDGRVIPSLDFERVVQLLYRTEFADRRSCFLHYEVCQLRVSAG